MNGQSPKPCAINEATVLQREKDDGDDVDRGRRWGKEDTLQLILPLSTARYTHHNNY